MGCWPHGAFGDPGPEAMVRRYFTLLICDGDSVVSAGLDRLCAALGSAWRGLSATARVTAIRATWSVFHLAPLRWKTFSPGCYPRCPGEGAVTNGWTNEAATGRWDAIPRAALDALEPAGGCAKRALLNPALLRLAGDLPGRRVLGAGCGAAYRSRMLAARCATVVGLEPAGELVPY